LEYCSPDRRFACHTVLEPDVHHKKRKAVQREALQVEIQEALAGRPTKERMRVLAQRLLDRAA
jgi:hypothetical protein